MTDPTMITWALRWLDAARAATEATRADDEHGHAHGMLAVIALQNARIAITRAAGPDHDQTQRLNDEMPGLTDMLTMLGDDEGEATLQEPGQAQPDTDQRPPRAPFWTLWHGQESADGAGQEAALDLTHLDSTGVPREFTGSVQDTLHALADMLITLMHENGQTTPDWLNRLATLAHRRRCDNPDCPNHVTWLAGRGRPPRFCTDRCRQRESSSRRRLTDRRDELNERLAATDHTARQAKEIQSEIALIEWHLTAYR